MNTEQRDPVLESLFAQSAVNLENGDGKAFTAGVMSGTRRMLRNVIYIAVGVLISLLVICLKPGRTAWKRAVR